MDCVVREGFPEEVALRGALKVGKREPHGRSEVSCPGPGSQPGAEPGVFSGTESGPRPLVQGEGEFGPSQACGGHAGRGQVRLRPVHVARNLHFLPEVSSCRGLLSRQMS